jgi:hypothetical protein
VQSVEARVGAGQDRGDAVREGLEDVIVREAGRPARERVAARWVRDRRVRLSCTGTHSWRPAIVVAIQSAKIFPLHTCNFVNFWRFSFRKFPDRPASNPKTNPNPENKEGVTT